MTARMTGLMIPAAALLAASLLVADSHNQANDPTGIAGKIPAPQSLFDGKTFDGWTTKAGEPVTEGWVVQDGCIHHKSRGGNIYTEKEYGDFIFLFDWKMSHGGNSGIKYRCDAKSMIGPEYQLLDDANHRNGKNPKTCVCAIYDVKAPAPDKPVMKPGQWNRGKIVAIGTRYEHWINGVKVLEVDTASREWKDLKAKSKYRKNAAWGTSPTGKIMIQDHGDEVWFRNLVIIDLSAES